MRFSGVPEGIRTHDLLIRSQSAAPISSGLQAFDGYRMATNTGSWLISFTCIC